MKPESKIPQQLLIERLSRKLNYPIGVNHFAVLVHAWMKKYPDATPEVGTLRARKCNDGYLWFKPDEVAALSHYAGYDLTQD